MMASIAMAVLPVWRSPMMSSRCPRPIGIDRVDCQDARLHGLVDGLAGGDARGLELHGAAALCLDRALAVDGHAQRVHDTAKQALAGRHLDDAAGGAHLVVFFNSGDITQKHGADLVLFEVLGQAVDGLATFPREFEELACHCVTETVDAGNSVADLDDRADFAGLHVDVQCVKLLAQCLVNSLSGDFSH